MATKIQINSLEALERLIGNDTELEIEIRNSVAQNFAKKHLKSLVTTELMADTAKAVSNEIKNEFFDTVKTNSMYSNSTTQVFKPEILTDFKNRMSILAKQELHNAVINAVNEHKKLDDINNKLNEALNWIESKLAPDVLEREIERRVNIRLKEKLGIS